MVRGKHKLVIDNRAKLQLQNAYNYIKKDSPQNAVKSKETNFSFIKEAYRKS